MKEWSLRSVPLVNTSLQQLEAQWVIKPQLYYQRGGYFEDVIPYLPELKSYRPTPWLMNHHAHIVYLDKIRKLQKSIQYDLIETLTMADGGTTAVAWYGLNAPPETPTIVVLHTITGTTASMAELVDELHQYTQWRIALCLRRGHDGLALTVPKINLFGSTEDLNEQLQHIQQKFPESDLYAAGSSAGTGLLVRHLGEQGAATPFKAAFALSPGYNTETGFDLIHSFYSRLMAQKLKEKFLDPYHSVWQKLPVAFDLYQAKNLATFERKYFPLAGYKDYKSYCEATNPIYVFENIKIPLMILNAEDDPICHIQNLMPYKNTILGMPNLMVVTTRYGSHCGFYEGLTQPKSWAHRLMSSFFMHHQYQQKDVFEKYNVMRTDIKKPA